MEIAALNCSSVEDLLRYASEIDAMGSAIGALAAHKSEHLTWSGEYLGWIISDYAKAIKSVLHDLYWTIERVFTNGDVSFLSELKRTKKDVQKGFMGLNGNLRLLKEAIDKIDQFVLNDFKQITELRMEFEKIYEEISRQIMSGSKQKETPATVGDQTGASGEDQS